MLSIGMLLLIAGSSGLAVTFTNFTVGDPHWIQGILTFGVFTVVGLVTIVILAWKGPEIY